MKPFITGSKNEIIIAMSTMKLSPNAKALMVFNFTLPDNTSCCKITSGGPTSMWNRFSEVMGQIDQLGFPVNSIQLYPGICDSARLLMALREKLHFSKPNDTDYKIEFVKATLDEIEKTISSFTVIHDRGTTHTVKVPAIAYQRALSAMITNVACINRGTTSPLTSHAGISNALSIISGSLFAAPDAPGLTNTNLRAMIRSRVDMMVMLTSPTFMQPESEHYRAIWNLVYMLFTQYGGSNMKAVRTSRQKTQDFKGSILDIVEQRGELGRLYALVCHLFFHEPQLPRLTHPKLFEMFPGLVDNQTVTQQITQLSTTPVVEAVVEPIKTKFQMMEDISKQEFAETEESDTLVPEDVVVS